MSEEAKQVVEGLPKQEANPAPAKKGFSNKKKANKKTVQEENNKLKQALQQLFQQVGMLSQMVTGNMQQTRSLVENSQAMSNLLRQNNTEEPAQDGDTLMLDFVGVLEDGLPFDGGSMLGSVMKLGVGQMLKDFEDSVRGMVPGETKTFNLTFPEDYFANLANKKVSFTVKLVKSWRPVEGDDEIENLITQLQAKKAEALKAEEEANEEQEESAE